MACSLGLSSPTQVWTGVIEYAERVQSSSKIMEGARVSLLESFPALMGTVLIVAEEGGYAEVQWDHAIASASSAEGGETLASLPPSSKHALSELKLVPPEIKPSAKRGGAPIPAKYGQAFTLGAVLTIADFDQHSVKQLGGSLDLCEYGARISLSSEWDADARELVLMETELLCGRNCDWDLRFNQDAYLPGTRFALKLNAEGNKLVGEFDGGKAMFQRERLFFLSSDAHAPALCVDAGEEEDNAYHNVVVSLTGEDSNSGVVLGNVGFARGVYYWEIRMDCAEEHGTVFVGCVERPNPHNIYPAGVLLPGLSRWERLPASFGFVNFRATQSSLHGGSEQIYGEFYETGNIIGVLLDMDQGEVSFFMDAIKYGEHVMRDLGVAFTPQQLLARAVSRFNPSGDAVQYLFPAIGLKKNVENSLSVSSKFIAFASSEAEEDIENLARLKQVLERCFMEPQEEARGAFPPWFKQQCYAHYLRMVANRYRRYPSRAGGRAVELDVSQEAMDAACAFGGLSRALRVGELVKTMQSQGRELATSETALVLGSRMNRVWYQIQTVSTHEGFGDGATWAFYWDPFELGMLIREEEEPSYKSAMVAVEALSEEEFISKCLDNAAWTLEQDWDLVRAVNATLQRDGEQDAMNLNITKFASDANKLGRIAVLRLMNCMARRALPLLSENGLAKQVYAARNILFATTKRAFWDAALRSTTTITTLPGEEYMDPPQVRLVQINRIKATPSKLAELPQAASRLKRSIFGQLYAETVRWPDHYFRRSYVGKGHGGQKRAFKVKLIGEGVDDYGGPYRQVFEAICDELQNDHEWSADNTRPAHAACLLPLLIPCPNRYHSTGDFGRDKFVLNCAATSPALLRRFEFLGKLMGTAMRHGLQLGLHFPALFWRQLVGLPVSLKHLEEIDTAFCRDLKRMEADPTGNGVPRAFQVTLSDGQTVITARDGFVDASNVDEYVAFCVDARLKESKLQFAALQRGLASVLPIEHFKLFTAEELEELVCGKRGLDLDLLRSITEYEGLASTDEHVLWFWEVLEETTLVQREMFLIFVWARSRMPNRADIMTKFRLQQPSGAAKDRADDFLPTAQTCFFSLTLPKYSSRAILKAKLLLAIECTLMDADVRLRNAEGWGEL